MSLPRLLSVIYVAMARGTKPEDRERFERSLDWPGDDIDTWGIGPEAEANQNALMGM